jgi:hypothetical protein
MRIRRLRWIAAIGLAASLAALSAAAQYDPIFDFIPNGGRALLTPLLTARPSSIDARALLAAKRSREEWVAYLNDEARKLPALQALSDQERLTLADYLSRSAPLAPASIPADAARADWSRILPPDGRDLALNYCQSCHIITVTVTQDRTQEHWLGTMNKPSHVGIKLTPQQREALASYLVLNAGIPIDQVPPALRAGGASY